MKSLLAGIGDLEKRIQDLEDLAKQNAVTTCEMYNSIKEFIGMEASVNGEEGKPKESPTLGSVKEEKGPFLIWNQKTLTYYSRMWGGIPKWQKDPKRCKQFNTQAAANDFIDDCNLPSGCRPVSLEESK
jgi:hypothetical protein